MNLALQGGGSHGAFTWGVLDALLEDGSLSFSGISGTSAGALNAAVLATGLATRDVQLVGAAVFAAVTYLPNSSSVSLRRCRSRPVCEKNCLAHSGSDFFSSAGVHGIR